MYTTVHKPNMALYCAVEPGVVNSRYASTWNTYDEMPMIAMPAPTANVPGGSGSLLATFWSRRTVSTTSREA